MHGRASQTVRSGLCGREGESEGRVGRDELLYSYMSQPKNQLETFKAWAGRDSDISYYLNSHHIDICLWMVQNRAIPLRVTASASQGIAASKGCVPETEDTITLLVDFAILDDSGEVQQGKKATASSPPPGPPQGAGVHSEQFFHYVASHGETRINQARRGYSLSRKTRHNSSPEVQARITIRST